MTKTRNGPERISQAFSGDLSKLLGERSLLQMVLEVVQGVDTRALEPQVKTVPRLRPRMMLTLVTYCYGACLFGSRDIEFAIGTDSLVRYICARTYPSWQEIRLFRRQNRQSIQKCLSDVLRQAWTMRCATNEAGKTWFETELGRLADSTAEGRIDTAALMDGADSD